MLMSKKNRLAIYATLFRDGVFVVAKDSSLEKHLTLDIPNIHALDAGKSLLNRGHVRETFSWQFHYFYLTDSGIEYLRQYLHLPAETVPNTHKKPARPAGAREERPYGGDRGDRGDRRPGGFGRGERAERSGGEGGYRRAAAPAATE